MIRRIGMGFGFTALVVCFVLELWLRADLALLFGGIAAFGLLYMKIGSIDARVDAITSRYDAFIEELDQEKRSEIEVEKVAQRVVTLLKEKDVDQN